MRARASRRGEDFQLTPPHPPSCPSQVTSLVQRMPVHSVMCYVCDNVDPGVSEFQRCDGGCDRWFCIEGPCARKMGVPNYKPDMSGGDLVCRDCRRPLKKLKTSSTVSTTAMEMPESRDQ